MAANDDAVPGTAARKPVRDGVDDHIHPATQAKSSARSATERTRDGLADARGRASDAYAAASERAGDAYAAARGTAHDARVRAADMLEANPIAAVLGGVALGVVIGALLPRTRRETELYGAVGARLTEAARAAAGAARDAGRDKLSDMGLNRTDAGATVRGIVDAALSAATDTSRAQPAKSGA